MPINERVLENTYEKLKENTKLLWVQKWFSSKRAQEITGLQYNYLNWQLSLLFRMGRIKKKKMDYKNYRVLYKCKR